MTAKWSSEYVVAEHKDLQAFSSLFYSKKTKKNLFFFYLGKHYGS